MIDRIKQVIEYSQLSSAAFADNIGISRSGLTHLLTGRNQPSLDVARKILAKYPELSTEWLIMGMGDMMRNEELEPVKNVTENAPEVAQEYPAENSKSMMQTDLFGEYENLPEPGDDVLEEDVDESVEEPATDVVEEPEVVVPVKQPELAAPAPAPAIPVRKQGTPARKSAEPKQAAAPVRRDRRTTTAPQEKKLEKIIFFYDDHSFEIYNA